jgi:signal transduction histidine kinase
MGLRISATLFFLAMVLPVPTAVAQGNMQANPDEVITHSDSSLVRSYLEEAAAAKAGGDIRRQRNLLVRAHEVADSLDVSSLIKMAEIDLGDHYLSTGSIDSALSVLEPAVERPSHLEQHIQALNLLATAYNYRSDFTRAMTTYNKGLSLLDSLESPDMYAAINANKAAIYKGLGNYSKAIALYSKGISYAETAKDSSFLVTALNNLGDIYNQQGKYREAKKYFEEGIALAREQDFLNSLVRLHHNMANSERDMGNFEAARTHYKKSWSLHERVRPDNPPVQLLHNMGQLYLKTGALDEAEDHFGDSMEYSKAVGLPPGLFYNFIGLGDVARQRGNRAESARYYEQALDIAQKIGAPPFKVTVNEKLYELQKEAGNVEKALQYHETAWQISDSLAKAQQDEQLALAETELGLRQQQKINELLQERQERQEARIQTQNWLIVVFAVVLVVIIISLYLLYVSNKERKRMNNELKELNHIKNKMMGIIAHDLRSPMSSMQGIFFLLKNEDLEINEVREMAAELEVSIQENINMMDNLLSWAKSQMRGLKIDIETVSVFESVDEVIENCALQASHKSIALLNEVDPNIEVEADINLLQLIIRNLVNNAIKFSNQGDTVTIMTEENSDEVTFKIKDTGIGIPKEERDGLFSLQGNSRSGTNDENGSGLGLKLCKEFVEKQNGTIDLETAVGEGTTFYVRLPKAS